MSEDTRHYLQTCLGDAEGWLCVAVGLKPYRDENNKYKHRKWDESAFCWPAQADNAITYITEAAQLGDTYMCPYLMRDRRRAKGNAVTRMLVHTDVDTRLDLAAVQELGGFAVASGTPQHGHAYVRLSYAVTAAQHEVLCRGLAKRLGGDPGKVSDNDLLRPVGSWNYKPTVDGADPVAVLAL